MPPPTPSLPHQAEAAGQHALSSSVCWAKLLRASPVRVLFSPMKPSEAGAGVITEAQGGQEPAQGCTASKGKATMPSGAWVPTSTSLWPHGSPAPETTAHTACLEHGLCFPSIVCASSLHRWLGHTPGLKVPRGWEGGWEGGLAQCKQNRLGMQSQWHSGWAGAGAGGWGDCPTSGGEESPAEPSTREGGAQAPVPDSLCCVSSDKVFAEPL